MEMKLLILFSIYILFFWLGYALIVKNAKRVFLLVAAFLTLLFFLSLMVIQYDVLLVKLPLWMQKNITLILWLILGGILGLLSVNYIYLKRVAATLLLNLLFIGLFWYYNEPIYKTINPIDPIADVTNQTTLYSCACASLSTIAKHKGIRISERKACKLIGTTRYGSNPGQIRYAARELGFGYRTLFGDISIEKVHPPAILFTDRRGGYENHAVAYIKRVGANYLLFDPMEGWRLLSHKQMQRIWHGRGIELF